MSSLVIRDNVYTIAGAMHRFVFPDGITIEAKTPRPDPYYRIWTALEAFSEKGHSLNSATFNVQNMREREDFARQVASLNGMAPGYLLPHLLVVSRQLVKDVGEGAGSGEESRVWGGLTPAPAFLGEADEDIPAIVRDVVFPGCVTLLAAPRGIGKSMSATSLAVALALGGRFRDDDLDQYRVALIDRDNPPKLVRIRLRRWGAEKAEDLHILTGEAVPKLTDKHAWADFPAHQYDLIIIDSIGGTTEGVSEKEGKETQLYLRTLRSLAERGPAILGLLNTIKSGVTYRGRGETADRADILYEVRDITKWTPENGDDWWLTLPEAGEHGWQDRARRRRGQTSFRLAFVPSKFRLGLEPQPFALEINTAGSVWTLADITASLSEEAHTRAEQRKQAERNKMRDAVLRLLRELEQAPKGQPIYKTDAVSLLHACGLPRKTARNLVEYGYRGILWEFARAESRGRGEILVLKDGRPDPIPDPKSVEPP